MNRDNLFQINKFEKSLRKNIAMKKINQNKSPEEEVITEKKIIIPWLLLVSFFKILYIYLPKLVSVFYLSNNV